tara:strand:- start:310 stop:624 length:315 start_codon:yes stop_codon:yes gene_type:complete
MFRVEQKIEKVSVHLKHVDKYSFRSFNWINSNSEMSKNDLYLEIKGENTYLEEKEELGLFLSFDQAIELRNILDDEIENVLQNFEKAVNSKLEKKNSLGENDCA